MSKKKPAKSDSSDDGPSFEECLGELEAIVGELEGGKLGLADALARYEQGVKHLKSCHGLLERAERRIEILSGVDAEGKAVTKPFDEQEFASLEERASARGKRRTSETPPVSRRRAAEGDDVDEGSRLF
ncbi:MAG TPA: exodeoxyribonuclease VII small subunit [Lacipirellulaceae bacterium]